MEILAVSALVVAIAEIGDKTQLLSLVLASRFRKPGAILLGIVVATSANHAVAAWAGASLGALLSPAVLHWVLIASFIGMAIWSLIPDRLDEEGSARQTQHGALITTILCFFVTEIGDKTQIATAALAARFETVWLVMLGTTIGMVAANLPAVVGGHLARGKFNLGWVRYAAAALFLAQAALVADGVELF